MDKATLKALKGSIKKWEGIVEGTGVDNGDENCPLCGKFAHRMDFRSGTHCEGCPVKAATGLDGCAGSPWIDWNDAMLARHGRRMDTNATDDETVMCAALELEFLKSLLPSKNNHRR